MYAAEIDHVHVEAHAHRTFTQGAPEDGARVVEVRPGTHPEYPSALMSLSHPPAPIPSAPFVKAWALRPMERSAKQQDSPSVMSRTPLPLTGSGHNGGATRPSH